MRPDALGVVGGRVIVILGHRREHDQALQPGLLELGGADPHGLVEQHVAALELLLELARTQQVADAKEQLGRVDRLVDEVARAGRRAPDGGHRGWSRR